MAEAISSAVIQLTVSQILSGLVQNYEEQDESNTNRNLERLEMAHIRLEAAVETSYKWQITDASLLRWRKKLKRAAQECGDTLRKCKQRILEDEQIEQEVRNYSLPKRIACATKSYVISVFSGKNNELSSSVQRFEWFAAGANDFLTYVELGGTPRRHVPCRSLVRNLLEGKELHHSVVQGNGCRLFQLWLLPYITTEHGIGASLILIQKDRSGPEVTIYFSIMLQLSETTDIVGIAIKCLHLFAPHFKCAIEDIMKGLTQLHTQNISWSPPAYSLQKEYNDLHSLATRWFRPNPSCCKQHNRSQLQRISNSGTIGLSDVSLEPVNEVTFQTFLSEDRISLQHAPSVKAGIIFVPHRSLNSILPAPKSSTVVAVVGEGQYCLHTNITLEQLKEIMLPKAIDYFRQNADGTVCQMVWNSEHAYALIHFEKTNMNTGRINLGKQRSFGRQRKRKLQEFRSKTRMTPNHLDFWGVHMSTKLQSVIMEWVQKEKEGHVAAEQLRTHELPYTWMLKETMEE